MPSLTVETFSALVNLYQNQEIVRRLFSCRRPEIRNSKLTSLELLEFTESEIYFLINNLKNIEIVVLNSSNILEFSLALKDLHVRILQAVCLLEHHGKDLETQTWESLIRD